MSLSKFYLIAIILFSIISILLFVIGIIYAFKGKDKKVTILTSIASLFSATCALITYLNTPISSPNIMPLNNEINIYKTDDNVEIIIESDGAFDIYYTLDGSDPKNGNKYETPFIITNSTTISARCKFFIWWSDISTKAYKFEEDSDKKFINNEINSDEKSTEDKSEVDTSISQTTEESTLELNSVEICEGQNPSKGMALLGYLNQYRAETGINELTWNSDLEQVAQDFAKAATTYSPVTSVGEFCIIIRQCNGIINAQEIVSDWITVNDYDHSKELLSSDYAQMGGALYYLPNGNENGYHYFWVICMK